ncbi:capsid assembly scaffolding protein Gp46 family protein [Staphylococcus epidermidis]|uniref:capsid assembly scaffolding protein Gp46 family protein n=1 Tax=Staphylococcus epidermidis TaxID=1282 RepID=UPI003EE40458
MNEIKRLKLNLQHFAEDNPNDPEGKDKQSGNDQGDDDKKFFELTQSELDSQKHKAVNKALANQEKKFEQRLKEAVENARSEGESYAKLTQKEKEEKALSEREKALAEKEKEFRLRELKADVENDLKDKGLPTSFAESLIHLEDNEQINEVVNAIKEDFDRAVQEQVKEATRQSTPSGQRSDVSSNKKTSDSFAEIARQNRIIQ